MTTRASKRQKTEGDAAYTLIYWPGIPGRGELVRLAFEETGTPYTDTALQEGGVDKVLSQISTENQGDRLNPPPLAPPILKHGDLTINQLPNILMYLGDKLGLVPETENGFGHYHVHELALTALDGFLNEAHDVHHPIASGQHYEEQKDEALKKAKDYRENRLTKFLEYFERVLSGEASQGGEYLYAGKLSYADLALFQSLDGVMHALPKAMAGLRKSTKYNKVFALYDRVQDRDSIKQYLASERRQKYGMGIWRHYPELDE